MSTRLKATISEDGTLTVEGRGSYPLTPDPLAGLDEYGDPKPLAYQEGAGRYLGAANAKVAELGLSLDYAWFGEKGDKYGHLVPFGARTGVWD